MGSGFTLAGLDYLSSCAFLQKEALPVARALWLQRNAQRFPRIFGLVPQVSGPVPSGGLVACNHLSYLDILVLGACAPAVFVAKRDVKHWPVFGWFACLAGTIFVHRSKRMQAGRFVDELESVLNSGMLVILLPEGTSSDGRTVLPFKSSLLKPAVRQAHPFSAGLIKYEFDDGDMAEEVCYWKGHDARAASDQPVKQARYPGFHSL